MHVRCIVCEYRHPEEDMVKKINLDSCYLFGDINKSVCYVCYECADSAVNAEEPQEEPSDEQEDQTRTVSLR